MFSRPNVGLRQNAAAWSTRKWPIKLRESSVTWQVYLCTGNSRDIFAMYSCLLDQQICSAHQNSRVDISMISTREYVIRTFLWLWYQALRNWTEYENVKKNQEEYAGKGFLCSRNHTTLVYNVLQNNEKWKFPAPYLLRNLNGKLVCNFHPPYVWWFRTYSDDFSAGRLSMFKVHFSDDFSADWPTDSYFRAGNDANTSNLWSHL